MYCLFYDFCLVLFYFFFKFSLNVRRAFLWFSNRLTSQVFIRASCRYAAELSPRSVCTLERTTPMTRRAEYWFTEMGRTTNVERGFYLRRSKCRWFLTLDGTRIYRSPSNILSLFIIFVNFYLSLSKYSKSTRNEKKKFCLSYHPKTAIRQGWNGICSGYEWRARGLGSFYWFKHDMFTTRNPLDRIRKFLLGISENFLCTELRAITCFEIQWFSSSGNIFFSVEENVKLDL